MATLLDRRQKEKKQERNRQISVSWRGENNTKGGSDTGCLLFISQLLPGVLWMLIKL